MNYIKISLYLLLALASPDKSECRSLQQSNDKALWSNLKQPGENCFCYADPGSDLKVSEILGPYHLHLERIVTYIYRDTGTNEIKLYIPNKTKQELIPELSFELEDKLITATDLSITDFFNTYNEFNSNVPSYKTPLEEVIINKPSERKHYNRTDYTYYYHQLSQSDVDNQSSEHFDRWPYRLDSREVSESKGLENVLSPTIEKNYESGNHVPFNPHGHNKNNDQFLVPDGGYQSYHKYETWSYGDDIRQKPEIEPMTQDDYLEYEYNPSEGYQTIKDIDSWPFVVDSSHPENYLVNSFDSDIENGIYYIPDKIERPYEHNYDRYLDLVDQYQLSKQMNIWSHGIDNREETVTAQPISKESMIPSYYLENKVTPSIEKVYIPNQSTPAYSEGHKLNYDQLPADTTKEPLTAETVSKEAMHPNYHLENEVTPSTKKDHTPGIFVTNQPHDYIKHHDPKPAGGYKRVEVFEINYQGADSREQPVTAEFISKESIVSAEYLEDELTFSKEKEHTPGKLITNQPHDYIKHSNPKRARGYKPGPDSREQPVTAESISQEYIIPGEYSGDELISSIENVDIPGNVISHHPHSHHKQRDQLSKPNGGYQLIEEFDTWTHGKDISEESETSESVTNESMISGESLENELTLTIEKDDTPGKFVTNLPHDYIKNRDPKPAGGYKLIEKLEVNYPIPDSREQPVTAESVSQEYIVPGEYSGDELISSIENVDIPGNVITHHPHSHHKHRDQLSKPNGGYQLIEEFDTWTHGKDISEESETSESVTNESMISGEYIENELTPSIEKDDMPMKFVTNLPHDYIKNRDPKRAGGYKLIEKSEGNYPGPDSREQAVTAESVSQEYIVPGEYSGDELTSSIENVDIPENVISHHPHSHHKHRDQLYKADGGYQVIDEFDSWTYGEDISEESETSESVTNESMVSGEYLENGLTLSIEKDHTPGKFVTNQPHGYNKHRKPKPERGYKLIEEFELNYPGTGSREQPVTSESMSKESIVPGEYLEDELTTSIKNVYIPGNILSHHLHSHDKNLDALSKPGKVHYSEGVKTWSYGVNSREEKTTPNYESGEKWSMDASKFKDILVPSRETKLVEDSQQSVLAADNIRKAVTDITMNGNKPFDTFDSWFHQEMERFENYKEHDRIFKISVIERYVLKILADNNMHITSEGVLIGPEGAVLDFHKLNLRPIFIGKSLDFGNFLKEKEQKFLVPNDLPYLQAILVTYTNPSMILGIIPMGKTVIPPSSVNNFSTTYQKSSYKKSGKLRHLDESDVSYSLSSPELLRKRQHYSVEYGPAESKQFLIDDNRNSKKYPRSVDSVGANSGLAKSIQLFDFDGTKFDDLSAEVVMKKVVSAYRSGDIPSEWNLTSPSSDDVDEDDIAGRIIGGNAATSSGTPLSVRGRMNDV